MSERYQTHRESLSQSKPAMAICILDGKPRDRMLTQKLTDLKADLESYARHKADIAPLCRSEEQTKISLINPYLELLGYDVRDPRSVQVEYRADVPGGKGEKVDYAILHDGSPSILIEAKPASLPLPKKATVQLARYFVHTPATLAVLTNGIEYRWFAARQGNSSEIADVPILTHDTLNPGDAEVSWLHDITYSRFNPAALVERTNEERARTAIRDWFEKALREPPDGAFARYLCKALDLGIATKPVRDRVRKAATLAFNDALNENLQATLERAASATRSDKRDQPSPAADEVGTRPGTAEETLSLPSGEVLGSSGRARAWRIGEGPWIRERNAKELLLAIVGAVVQRDRRRNSPDKLVSMAPGRLFVDAGLRRDPVPGVEGLWLAARISNEDKQAVLKQIIAAADPDPSAGSRWNGSSKIEWWLPTLSSSANDPGSG